MSTDPAEITRPARSAWQPRSTGATVVLWVARVVALLPVLYFVFMAMASLACFSDSCRDDSTMIYAVPAVAAAVLFGWTPYAAVRVLQVDASAPGPARIVGVLAGHAVVVWGVFIAFIVSFIRATGV
ncbi:hypothetical protein [Actinoplanes sichuanensis]|uniref:Uncharacterized protein n=1 Tax=Actinoplanes sichuanensis TaxID=512349 RepID=A0ABW4AAT1_9ACTN|nr:hypothetical protein [Actinoplanes sichuanensis]